VIVAESSRTRRVVGRLDRDSDLIAQLTDLCRERGVRAGELRVVGTVADPTLGQRRLDGTFELVTFACALLARTETPSLQAAVTLAREDGALVGGRLVAARVVACEFVLDVFEDVVLEAPAEAKPVMPVAPVAVPTPLPVPVPLPVPEAKPVPMFDPPAKTSWSDVMRASEQKPTSTAAAAVEDAVADADEPLPPSDEAVHVRVGDFIDHPKFGRVAVERVDSDQEYVTARLRNQRLIRLSLDVLTLIPAGQAEGKNLFRAVAGK
jgi:predicted DNA-binding protein with PD1-like motif